MIHNESEFIRKRDGTEVCRECKHVWSEDGISHYPDCRYYWHEEDTDDEEIGVVTAAGNTVPIKTAA